MERQRDAQAVMAGRLQASLSNLVLGQPGNQLPSGELAKLLERGFAPASKLVSSLETSMPRTASV
jgi:hypothetical protein